MIEFQKRAGRTIEYISSKVDVRTKLLTDTGLILLYGLVGVVLMGRVFFHPQTWVLGGYGDTQQFMWYLGWFWHAILHGENVLYTYQINAPIGQNLMWNTSILAESALFGWLVPHVQPIVLYNELWLFNFVLSCMLGRAILRNLSANGFPAIVGGFLMGIMPYESSQMLFHLHLWMTTPILAIMLIFIKQYKNRKVTTWRSGLLLGILAALEFYTSLETCVTFALCTVLFWIIASILKRDPIVIGNIASWGTAVLVTAILCLPGLYGLFMLPGLAKGTLLPPGVYVNDLMTFLIPTPAYQLHSAWTTMFSAKYTGNFWENDGYIGLPAVVVVLIGVWKLRKNRLIVASFVSMLMIAILSLGPNLHILGGSTTLRLPWSVVQPFPFFRDIIPSRLMLYGDIFIILIIVIAWSRTKDFTSIRFAAQMKPAKGRKEALLVCLTILSWLPVLPYISSHVPAGESVVSSHPEMMQDLVNQQVFVLTSDASIFMQTMADSKYRISMVNPYGYASNTESRDEIRAIHTSFSGSDSEARELVQELSKSGATRVLYFPVGTEDQIPTVWYETLNQQFGKPQISVDHVLIWNLHG